MQPSTTSDERTYMEKEKKRLCFFLHDNCSVIYHHRKARKRKREGTISMHNTTARPASGPCSVKVVFSSSFLPSKNTAYSCITTAAPPAPIVIVWVHNNSKWSGEAMVVSRPLYASFFCLSVLRV